MSFLIIIFFGKQGFGYVEWVSCATHENSSWPRMLLCKYL